jgi:hypothetical protein
MTGSMIGTQELTTQVRALSGSDGGQVLNQLQNENRELRAQLDAVRRQLQHYQFENPLLEEMPEISVPQQQPQQVDQPMSAHSDSLHTLPFSNHQHPPSFSAAAGGSLGLALTAEDLIPRKE